MGLADFATVKSNDAKNFPGPGQYAATTQFGKVRREHITFKGRYRETSANQGGKGISTTEEVGPGKYNININSTAPSAPCFSISAPHAPMTNRAGNGETDLGPAYSPRQYQIGSDPSGPKFSFGSKHHEASGAGGAAIGDNPGPEYTLPSTLAKGGVKIAGTPRRYDGSGGDGVGSGSSSARSAQPGPGAYSIPRFGDKLPSEQKIQVHKAEKEEVKHPGPQEYYVEQHTIVAKTTPRGPNKGNLTGRNYPPLPSPCGAPGPAAYEIQSPIGRAAQAKTMGSKPVETSQLDAIYPKPGPGDYDLPSCFSGNKGSTFGSRPTQYASKFATPGPGHVDVPQLSMAKMIEKDSKGFRFTSRSKAFERPVEEVNEDPVTGKKIPSWKSKPSDGPGPASYNPKPPGRAAPAYSMTAREHKANVTNVERDNVPGPGTYEIHKAEAAQMTRGGITFYKGSFADVRAGNDVPGPGSYADGESFNKTKPSKGSTFSVHPVPPLPGKGFLKRGEGAGSAMSQNKKYTAASP